VHGGGCIGGSAEWNAPCTATFATKFNAIGFSIQYTFATQGTAEQMATDVVAAIKHVRANADEYGVDLKRMVMHGNSGGGFAVLAASNLLAMNNEAHFLNLIFVSQPSCAGYFIKTKLEDMPNDMVREGKDQMTLVTKGFARNLNWD